MLISLYENNSFAKYGNNVLKIKNLTDTQFFLRANYSNVNNLKGHKIYAKVSTFRETTYINPIFYLEFTQNENYWYNDDTNPYFQYVTSYDYNNYGGYQNEKYIWRELSLYSISAEYDYLKIMLAQANSENTINGIMYYDGLIVIDLTTTFGSGNEPDNDWCDKHINYFDGTTTIYK